MLSACGSSSGNAPGSTAASGVSLVNAGKLTVCTSLQYPPFESNNDQGETVGFDVDLMDLVSKKLGATTSVIDTPFEGIKSGQDLSTGKCDIAAAGMTITDERAKVILFSSPYFNATQALSVKTGSAVTGLADLKGKKLAAQTGTTGKIYADAHKAEFGYEVTEYPDFPTETEALKTGQVQGAINDLPVWLEEAKTDKGVTKVVTQFDTGEQYGFGMKLGNTALKKVVDEMVATTKSDGSYNTIYKKWTGTDAPKS